MPPPAAPRPSRTDRRPAQPGGRLRLGAGGRIGWCSRPTDAACGRSPSPGSSRGERAVGRVPHGRREQVALIAALTPAGIAAPVLLPGALDRPACDAWLTQERVPTLRPGQTVLLDNLSAHQHARALVEAAGRRLLPSPRSSPDLNPIASVDALVAAARPALEAATRASTEPPSPPSATRSQDRFSEWRSRRGAMPCASRSRQQPSDGRRPASSRLGCAASSRSSPDRCSRPPAIRCPRQTDGGMPGSTPVGDETPLPATIASATPSGSTRRRG